MMVLAIGAGLACLGVLCGAFGAHALAASLSPQMLVTYHTAVEYHLLHAIAIVIVGALIHRHAGSTMLRVSGWLLITGVVLFSGSLYALVLGAGRSLAVLTPIGGLAFIAGWLVLMIAAIKMG